MKTAESASSSVADVAREMQRVSCLMVTRADPARLAFAKKSIADYCRQTWKNRDLLILMCPGFPGIQEALREHVQSLGRDDIHVCEAPSGLTLGGLRNLSRELAKGDIFCQWDDDDRHHPERIERQLTCLLEGEWEAVCLQEVMQYFPVARKLYWTNWHATEANSHPGTLMVRREVPVKYPAEGESAWLGEDSAIARDLKARGRFGCLDGQPYLYVYVSHGDNSWHEGHHRMLADKLSISRALLRRREAQLRAGLAILHFADEAVTVQGNNGPAFEL